MRSRSIRRRDEASPPSGAGRRASSRASLGGRTIMSILSALLFFHAGLFRAGLFITVIIAIWGLVIYIRKLPPSGGFRSTLVLTGGLFIVQGLVGIAMFLGGRRPHDGLHWLSGILLVIVLPIAASYTSGRDPRREPLVYGIAGLFMAGVTNPAFSPGAWKKKKGPFWAPFVPPFLRPFQTASLPSSFAFSPSPRLP